MGFNTALRDLDAKIAARRREAEEAGAAKGVTKKTGAESKEEKARRMEAIHRQIRADIEKMHARLGTGIASSDIDELKRFLREATELSAPGKDSHELLPRARFSIFNRLNVETGRLAVSRLTDLLEKAGMTWPETQTYHPSATPEDVERARQRHLAELKESFLESSIERVEERLVGVVAVWKADYPSQGSPLWNAAVLECVSAGIRAQLLKEFVERVRQDRSAIEAEAEDLIGAELTEINQCLKGGVDSIQDANRAVAASLRVLDEVLPDLVWERIYTLLPRARGEWTA